MNPEESQPQTNGSFFQRIIKYKKILIPLFIFLFFVVSFTIFITSKAGVQTQTENNSINQDKTWELVLGYDREQDKLVLNKFVLLDKKITPDYRGAKGSAYKLRVLDSRNNLLYETNVNITQELIFNILNNPDSSESAQPQVQPKILNTVLYIPYFKNANRIVIFKEEKSIFEIFIAKKKASLNFIFSEKAYAQACQPLVTVFISDRYTDYNRFHEDVQTLENAFREVAPYSNNPGMFDFKILDNTEPLGCEAGIISCINNTRIEEIGSAAYPNASKFIVVANQRYGGGVLGVTNQIGGNKAVFPSGLGGVSFTQVAIHEFLGHAVGLLYDRYVSATSRYGKLQNGIRSNCTDNLNGESFWSSVGIKQTFLGCGNKLLYASTQSTCSTSNPSLISGGDPTSIMSASGCGGGSFDPVEQEWIKQQILPDYQGCSTGGITPTSIPITNALTPTLPPGVTPTQAPTLPPGIPTSIPTGGGLEGASPTPTLTPTPAPIATYTCVQDPSCVLGQKNLQLCHLICTPQ